MINLDRTEIKKKLKQHTKYPLSNDNNKFDDEIPKLMRDLQITENPLIQNDSSYSIAYFPEFIEAVYYEYILPYIKHDESISNSKIH